MGSLRFVPRSLAPEGTPAGDALRGKGSVLSLLPGLPSTAADARARAGDGSARLPASAFRVSGEAAGEKLAAILAGDGVLVSTGQQPDLFGGPLYVLYKALGACVVAEALEEDCGVPALPMFWVASDDHDWDEVGRVEVLDSEGEPHAIVLAPPPGRAGRSVGRTVLPDAVGARIDELSQYIPQSEFSDRYLELLRGAYTTSGTLGGAFLELLRQLLDRDLVLLDSGSEAVRRAAAPLYARVVRERGRVADALARGEEAVRLADYEPQLHRREGGILLFVDGPAGRVRLLEEGEGVREGRDGPVRTEDGTLAELAASPERFSPNVALRPVLESWLLPVAATVLGPSELAYWAELPPLFRWADVPLPAVRARPSWHVVESKVWKVLDKLDVAPEAFADGGESLVDRVTEEALPAPVRDGLEKARGEVGEAFGTLEEAVEAELPGVRSSVGAARHAAFTSLDELERSVAARVRERQSVVVEQIRKAARHLYPDGRPQERVLTPFYFLSRYGDGFLAAARESAAEWSRERRGDVAGAGEAG